MDVRRGLNVGTIGKVAVILLCSLMFACGGGGGGKTGGSNPPPNLDTKPWANAGEDLFVNAGDRVDLDPKVLVANVTSTTFNSSGLELKGSSDNKQAIVSLVWSKLEGPGVDLRSSGFNDGKIHFIAPSTNGASLTKITFKLLLTNAAGLTSEDTISIYISRVNEAPVANAGDDFTVLSGDVVELRGRASDLYGAIVSFQWTQTSGTPVTLNSLAWMESSFEAPIVYEETNFEFELSVEDDEGAFSKDRVTVSVYPRDVPKVELYFPPTKGIYTESTLSLFGTAESITSNLTSLTVDAGNGPVNVDLNADGSWRLNNFTLPTGVAEISIVVTATDLEGRKGIARSQLQTATNVSVGAGQGWNDIVGIDVDPSLNKLWMATRDNTNMKLLSVNLSTGDRSPTVSDFSNANQGVSTEKPGTIIFDGYRNQIYMSAGDSSSATDSAQIIGIDIVSGNRYVVSDSLKGVGPALKLPWGLALAGHETLQVADNHTDSILAIHLVSGARAVIADSTTPSYGIDAPFLLANNRFDDTYRLFVAPYSDVPYVFKLDLSGEIATNDLVLDGMSPPAMGEVKGLLFEPVSNTLFFYTFFEGLVAFDMSGNQKKNIVGPAIQADALAMDHKRSVIYMVDGFPKILYAVDPVSGSTVIVSKP